MAFERLEVGRIEVLALLDADRALDDPITSSFPDIPPDELLAFRDRAPGVYGPGDAWRFRSRACLVRHPGGVVLVDTGVGRAGAPALEWFREPGRLVEVLEETGTPTDEIDTVVITHVHDDHIGGTVVFDDEGVATPAFPRARYVLQRADREWQRELAADDEEDRIIDDRLLRPLEDAGMLDLIDGDHRLAEGIDLHPVPGHTPGHQVVRLGSKSARALLAGDTFNHPIQIGRPDLPSGPDNSHKQAAAARREVLAELLADPGTTLAPTHFAEAFGHVRADGDDPASWFPL